MRLIARGGRYLRVADPDWDNPLDGSYSARFGGRWNPPGSFPVCYLNHDLATAKANARLFLGDRLAGMPFTVDDLDPDELPVLVDTDVADAEFVDVVTAAGCRGAGLPTTYPHDAAGGTLPWALCQPTGVTAWDANHPGIACRSAARTAPADGEELAWFQRTSTLQVVRRQRFEEWFGPVD